MFFERKAFIEFVDKSTIQITTPFLQKRFDLENLYQWDLAIDLVKLTSFPTSGVHPEFYAFVGGEVGVYVLEVCTISSNVGSIDFSIGKQVFKIKIQYD